MGFDWTKRLGSADLADIPLRSVSVMRVFSQIDVADMQHYPDAAFEMGMNFV
jgi:hypothetical protein